MKQILKVLAIGLLFFSCKNEKNAPASDRNLTGKNQNQVETPFCEKPETDRVAMALLDYFGEEVETLVKENRQFSYDAYDLNGDGKTEYFVGLSSPYFCGSGGCTAFIFNNDLTVHSRFTVIDFPVYVSKRYITEGWSNLFIYSAGKFHLVKFDGTKYPTNPSLEPEIEVDNYPDRVALLIEAHRVKCAF